MLPTRRSSSQGSIRGSLSSSSRKCRGCKPPCVWLTRGRAIPSAGPWGAARAAWKPQGSGMPSSA
eukprot:2376598-Lingulodinium_polyedra.AAC.1